MATALHNNTGKKKQDTMVNLANTTGKSICTVNSSDKSSRLFDKSEKNLETLMKIYQRICFPVFFVFLVLRNISFYFLMDIKILGFFQKKKARRYFSTTSSYLCLHPRITPVLTIMGYPALRWWDRQMDRWDCKSSQSAKKWTHGFKEETEGISWLKNTSHHKNKNKGIKNINFSIIKLFWAFFRSCN